MNVTVRMAKDGLYLHANGQILGPIDVEEKVGNEKVYVRLQNDNKTKFTLLSGGPDTKCVTTTRQ